MPLCLFILLSCKDFKSWESRYTDQIHITFEQKKDDIVPDKLESLRSVSLKFENFQVDGDIIKDKKKNDRSFTLENPFSIYLKPTINQTSFTIYNDAYYQKITISYECIVSLISPDAGGLQQKYIIKNVEFSNKKNKKTIFKTFKIENRVPSIKEDNTKLNDNHVTIYY